MELLDKIQSARAPVSLKRCAMPTIIPENPSKNALPAIGVLLSRQSTTPLFLRTIARAEQAVLDDSIRTFDKASASGSGGLSRPRAHPHRFLRWTLIAENDFWYSCDLFQDDQPQPLKTQEARKLVSMPYSAPVNDVITYSVMVDPGPITRTY